MTTVRIMMYKPHERGEVCAIERDDLKTMQTIVGGYIQVVAFERGLLLVCNEDGLRLRLPLNRIGVVGTFFIARQQGEEFGTLTDHDVVYIRSRLDFK